MPSIEYIRPVSGREADFGNSKDMRVRRSWLSRTDSRFFSEGLFLQAAVIFDGGSAGVPIPFVSRHPDNAQFLCKRLRGKQEQKSPLHWRIDAEYDTAPIDREDSPESPLSRPAKITWSTIKYQKAVERDREGNAILNSAGDYFDPPVMKDLSRWTVSVSKNVAAVPTDIIDYPDALNSGTFSIGGISIEQNVAKIMGISISDLQKEGDIEYYVFQYTLEFDAIDKWKCKPLQHGFYCLENVFAGTPDKIRCTDSNGKPAVSPQLLADNGTQIGLPITPGDAKYGDYNIYHEMDFSVLPVA